MAVVINGDTGISPVTASGTSASVDGMTVGRGGGEVSTNTAVGASALNANTTGSLSVAIGASALAANTTSDANTAVGYQAASTQTTGALYTTAFGYRSLKANTSGTQNNALGFNSLTANTTGANNSGFGTQTLAGNTTGGSNTAFGNEALRSNTTASNNTAVGYQAGYSFTTGLNNTVIGSQAGDDGNFQYSVIVGSRAGGNQTSGDQNTYVGEEAGGAMTTGGRNTIIGRYTGNAGGLDIRTASNYIVLSDGDGNPRGIFTNSGYLCIGGATTTTYNESLRINTAGQQGIHINDTTSASSINYQYFTKGSGPTNVGAIYYNGSVMAYQTTSDYRLKENVAPITNALNKIALLNPVTYRWKDNQQSGEGFIAHELQEHFPDAVSGTKDEVDENGNPKYQGMDSSVLIATMVKAIQELKAEFDAYKATHP